MKGSLNRTAVYWASFLFGVAGWGVSGSLFDALNRSPDCGSPLNILPVSGADSNEWARLFCVFDQMDVIFIWWLVIGPLGCLAVGAICGRLGLRRDRIRPSFLSGFIGVSSLRAWSVLWPMWLGGTGLPDAPTLLAWLPGAVLLLLPLWIGYVIGFGISTRWSSELFGNTGRRHAPRPHLAGEAQVEEDVATTAFVASSRPPLTTTSSVAAPDPSEPMLAGSGRQLDSLATVGADATGRVTTAFTIGTVALAICAGPVVWRLLPWGGGLYGISLDGLGPLVPVGLVVSAIAACLIWWSVRRWCELGGTSAQNRRRLARNLAAGIVVPVLVLTLVDATAPLCPSGRTCVVAAKLSLVLPNGWSRRIADADHLFEAEAGDSGRVVIEDGHAMLGAVASLDEVERAATSYFGGGSIGYGRADLTSKRIDLPIGPAVRVTWESTPWFYDVHQGNITDWVFLDGRLVVIEYQDVPAGHLSADFSIMRESLRTLGN